MKITRKTKTIEGLSQGGVPVKALIEANEPAVLKGVALNWPMVQHGLKSPQQAMDYIKSFYNGRPIVRTSAPAKAGGKLFYNEEVSALNCISDRVPLEQFFDQITSYLQEEQAPALYMGSTDLNQFFPGFRANNDLPLANSEANSDYEYHAPLTSIWMGNRTCACAHYDFSNNIAGCMVGHRRFTMFPPAQIHNLYPGPLEPTPGGQVLSMVDFESPDFDAHPNFKHALEAGQVAELEPGDLLFIPSMWWHQVEALDSFNVLINYWWNTAPSFIDSPQTTLLHAMLSLRDRPDAEKQAWREVFEYYVFGDGENVTTHLPEHAHGNLGPMDEMKARRLRAQILNRLNR